MQEIEALIKCHKEHPYAKFWGKCNQVKWELDACFREEKTLKRYKDGKSCAAEHSKMGEH